jgi:hypothetical protein
MYIKRKDMKKEIDVSDVMGKADPNSEWFTHSDVFEATFIDPQSGEIVSVGEAYSREDDSPAYQKALTYLSSFDPDREVVMGTPKYDELQQNI